MRFPPYLGVSLNHVREVISTCQKPTLTHTDTSVTYLNDRNITLLTGRLAEQMTEISTKEFAHHSFPHVLPTFAAILSVSTTETGLNKQHYLIMPFPGFIAKNFFLIDDNAKSHTALLYASIWRK